MRTEESLEGRAKDCSKGLGSRSKLLRLGRGGGRDLLAGSTSEAGDAADVGDLVLSAGMTWVGLNDDVVSVSIELDGNNFLLSGKYGFVWE